jgi:Tfp pilus assembly protein PilX
MLLLVLSTIGTAVLATTISASHQSGRDRSVKRAIAAADAGLQSALYRINKLSPKDLECVVTGTVAGATGLTVEPVQTDGWCRAQTEDLGDGASYSYRVKGGAQVNVNGQNLIQRKVVATGTVNGVTRRAATVVGSSTGITLFGGYAVVSLDDFNLPNSSQIVGNTGSNGNISLSNNAEICGNATPGVGKQFTTSNAGHLCSGYTAVAATQPFVLNQVDQGNSSTVNNNGLIGVLDAVTKPLGFHWNAVARTLQLTNGSTLTLTGDVYSFCSLEVDNNSQIVIAPRAPGRPPLKIFLDSPENCGGAGKGSAVFRNGGAITNLNTDPTTLQLYVVGSNTIPSSISYENNFATTQLNVLIYAPLSTVSFNNHTSIVGAVAAKQVQMDNNTAITWDRRSNDITVDNLLPHYQRQMYSECSATASGLLPDSDC